MAERICPTCGRGIITRCGRKGPWEKYVLPLFGVFPWRCARCRTRLRLSDRGVGFKRVHAKPDYFDDVVTEPAPTPQAAEGRGNVPPAVHDGEERAALKNKEPVG